MKIISRFDAATQLFPLALDGVEHLLVTHIDISSYKLAEDLLRQANTSYLGRSVFAGTTAGGAFDDDGTYRGVASGNVTNVTVEKSSRNRDLDRAAMEAARKWRFNAAVSFTPTLSKPQVGVNAGISYTFD
mgnify:CR=1 FL=1